MRYLWLCLFIFAQTAKGQCNLNGCGSINPSSLRAFISTWPVHLDCNGDAASTVLDMVCLISEIPGLDPPQILPIGNQLVTRNYAINLTVDASDPNGDQLTYGAEGLPNGSSFDPQTHLFQYTPTANDLGTYQIEFWVDDGFYRVSETIQLMVKGLTTIKQMSPFHMEEEVAVTRESRIKFDYPIDGTTITDQNVKAMFGSQELAGWRHLSDDGKTITLFYNNPLPPSARIRIMIDGNTLLDSEGINPDVDGNDVPGGLLSSDFDTLSLTPLAGTSVSGRVFASEPSMVDGGPVMDVPLEGVRISIDGLEATHFTITDATGNFTLEPVPAGRFFVHIDGRTVISAVIGGIPTATSYPAGPYYPFVGKAWQGRANDDTSAGDIFLPLVLPGTLQALNPGQETTIHFPQSVIDAHPEWADVAIRVPADSLFANDGTPGGMVGIAPVDPARLPGQLPAGLDPAIVLTVQTDGASNFSTPAPICFPNLPDPMSGLIPPPGTALALLSFNHDAGRWEHVGEATVNTDGSMVCTDPGSGIIAPGWHLSVPCSPSHFHNPKYQCRQDCVVGIMWGIIDCALSFIPVSGLARCALSLTLTTVQIARDCVNDPDSAGCVISVVGNLLSAATSSCASSIANNIPGLGQILACGGGALGAIAACSCLADKGGEPWEPRINAELAFLESYHDLALLVLGDGVWTSLDPEDPDHFLKRDQVTEIIETLLSAANGSINASEAASILALDRPSELSAQNVQDLIDRFNNTLTFWGQGLFTHAQAGQTDFLDRDQFNAALDAIDSAIFDLQSMGIEEFDLNEPAETFAAYANESLADSETLDPKGVYYRLDARPQDNVITPPTRFGQLGAGGTSSLVTLPPGTPFNIQYYDPVRSSTNSRFFQSNANGIETLLPETLLIDLPELDGSVSADDLDGDRLHNTAESVIGTNELDPDTDGDGIEDGAEVEFGLNPLDGLLLNLGLVFQVASSYAFDIDVNSQLIGLAQGTTGVSLFNAFNGMDPRIIAQVNTPGNAKGIAIGEGVLAVADGTAGLTVIDITDPPAANILFTVPLGGDAQTVDTDLGLAYVGMNASLLVVVDLQSGSVIQRLNMPLPVVDVAVGLDSIYVLHIDRVSAVSPYAQFIWHTTAALGIPAAKNLAVANDTLFVIHDGGYATLDLLDPTMPVLVSAAYTGQYWSDMALNGSGLGVSGVNSLGGGGIEVFDVSDPSQTTTAAIQAYVFAPSTRAVEITNGLAYVAADTGLLVINYQNYDSSGMAPVIALDAPFSKGTWQVEEGTQTYASAEVTDDVQVRNVAFYLDGNEVHRDGSYPFNYRFITPLLSQQTSFTLQVKATDTGGNIGWSSIQSVDLLADTTAPSVLNQQPIIGKRNVNLVSAFFDEPLDSSTATATNFTLVEAGADKMFATADDIPISAQNVSYQAFANRVDFVPATSLADGLYQATIGTGVTDLAGNALATDFSWTFRVADAVFWIAGDGDFQAGLNWSEGVVPGASDHVIIDVPGSAIVTLNTAPARTIQSLEVHDTLRIEGGNLTAGQVDIYGLFDFKHGQVQNTILDNTFGGTLLGGTTQIGVLTCGLSNSTVVGNMNCAGRSVVLYGTFNLEGTLQVVTHSLVVNGSGIFGNGTINVTNTNITTNGSVYTIGAGITVVGNSASIHGQPQNYGIIQMVGGIQCSLSYLDNFNTVSFANTSGVYSGGTNTGSLSATNGMLSLVGSFQNNGSLTLTDTTLVLNMTGPYPQSRVGSYTRNGTTHIVVQGHMDAAPGIILNSATGDWELSGAVDALVSNGFIETFDGAQLILLEQPDNDPATFRNMEVRTNLLIGEKSRLIFDSGLTLTGATISLTGSPVYLRGSNLSTNAAGLQEIHGTGTIQALTFNANAVLQGNAGNHIVIGPGIKVTANGAIVGAYTQVTNQGLIEKSFGGGVMVLKGDLGFNNQGSICLKAGALQADHPISNDGVIDVYAGQCFVLEDDLTCSASATLRTHIASLASFGCLTGDAVDSVITLDGTLDIQLEGGYIPNLNDTFVIATGNSVSGNFTTVLNQSLGNGTMFQVNINAGDVTLEVVSE